MKKLSQRIAVYCMNQSLITREQMPWLIYGVEKRIISFYTSLLFLAIAYILTTPLCAISTLLSFWLLRQRTSGYHASRTWICLCVSVLTEIVFLGVVYLGLCRTNIIIITSVCVPIIWFGAPYNHPNMNFTQHEICAYRRSARRLLTILVLCIGLSWSLNAYEISKGITIGLAMTSFFLCLAYIIEWRDKYEHTTKHYCPPDAKPGIENDQT